LAYGQKIFLLLRLIDGVTDARQRPRIATARIVRSVLVMLLTRLG
jgi:hypothetical protein